MTHSDIDSPRRRSGLTHWILFAFAFALSINIGGALLASTVIFPVWSASPQAAAAWRGLVDEAQFFVVVSPIVLLLAIAVLLTSGRVSADSRWWMRLSAGLYIAFFAATLGYFVPGQEAMQGVAGAQKSASELGSMLDRWIALNWIRQAVGVLALGAALHAIGTTIRYGAVSVEAKGRSQ